MWSPPYGVTWKALTRTEAVCLVAQIKPRPSRLQGKLNHWPLWSGILLVFAVVVSTLT
jgi:hypothetical protein